MSLEAMKKFFDLIVEGANLTAKAVLSDIPKDMIERIKDEEAEIIDFEAYKRSGGLLN